jgi:hypothetical protein
MAYAPGAVERAMKVQEVILRALSGQLTWPQAADILGRSPRSIRRLRRVSAHRCVAAGPMPVTHPDPSRRLTPVTR